MNDHNYYYLSISILIILMPSICIVSGVIYDDNVNIANSDVIFLIPGLYTKVALINDFNGDNIDDIAINILNGEAYIYYGNSTINGTKLDINADLYISNTKGIKKIIGISDLNKDGYGDILYDDGVNVFLQYGSDDYEKGEKILQSNVTFYLDGNQTLSWEYCNIGDINGDGYEDIGISTWDYPDYPILCGTTYIIFGKPGKLDTLFNLSLSDASYKGQYNGDRIGYCISKAGDVNGDMFDDLLISSIASNDNKGKIFLIFGRRDKWYPDTNISQANASFIGYQQREMSGYSLSYIGDINGDNFDDIIIGAPNNNEQGQNSGKTYIVYGKKSNWINNMSLIDADVSINGDNSNDEFGYLVKGGGDINDDGYNDIIISSPKYSDDEEFRGKIHIIYGRSIWKEKNIIGNIENASFIGEDNYEYCGISYDGGKDINNDGYDDIIIGSNYKNKAYLFIFDYYINTAPIITSTDIEYINEDSIYHIIYKAIDNDPTTDKISWLISTDASWLAVNNQDGSISGIPRNENVGSYWINVTVTDDRGGKSWSNFTLTVNNTNDPPKILTKQIPDINEDTKYSFAISAIDIDPVGDRITWSIKTDNKWLSIDPDTGVLMGYPDNSDVGGHFVNVTADDGNSGTCTFNYTVEVFNVNDDPVIVTDPLLFAVEDQEYSQTFEWMDIDPTNDILTLKVATNASFLEYEPGTHTIHGVPTDDDVGRYWINATIDDDKGGRGVLNYTLTVLGENDPPVITTIDLLIATEDEPYLRSYAYIDPDGDVHRWSLSTNASFLQMRSISGVLSGTQARCRLR